MFAPRSVDDRGKIHGATPSYCGDEFDGGCVLAMNHHRNHFSDGASNFFRSARVSRFFENNSEIIRKSFGTARGYGDHL